MNNMTTIQRTNKKTLPVISTNLANFTRQLEISIEKGKKYNLNVAIILLAPGYLTTCNYASNAEKADNVVVFLDMKRNNLLQATPTEEIVELMMRKLQPTKYRFNIND